MGKRLFVGNVSWSATDDSLKDYFAQHGEVVSAKIIIDRETGKSKGFGFIEMENADEAMDALNGKDFEGRPLRISEARERQPRRQQRY